MWKYSLVFLCGILCIHCLNAVRIVGLFPDHENQAADYWMGQSVSMFRAAFTLARRYKLYVGGQPIDYVVQQYEPTPSNLSDMSLICQLIMNGNGSDILGFVGPLTSESARFLAPLATHTQLPFISYAATSFELSDIEKYPTFYRTVSSDAYLAEAIVRLFEKFKWHTCTMIIEKDDYGHDGVRLLLERYHRNISVVERILFDTRSNKFHGNLSMVLDRSPSRIVLIWASGSGSTSIIRHAIHHGFIPGERVWLTTNKIYLSQFSEQERPELRGLLSIGSLASDGSGLNINCTLREEAFMAWQESADDRGTDVEDSSKIAPYALYAFDAAWTFIQALAALEPDDELPSMTNRSCCFGSRLENRQAYFRNLKKTHFWGVSGAVGFPLNDSNDRVDDIAYALYCLERIHSGYDKNVPAWSYDDVMIWNTISPSWRDTTNKSANQRDWRCSFSNKIPSDDLRLQGQLLRILVLESPPLVFVRHHLANQTSSDTCNNKDNTLPTTDPTKSVYGFVVDFLCQLKLQLHLNYKVTIAESNISYDELVLSVDREKREYDMVFAAIRITSRRLALVDFSTSIYEHTLLIVTRPEPGSRSLNLFSFLNPFTISVWIAILGTMLYTGGLVYVFEREQVTFQHPHSRIGSICLGMCRVMTSVIIMSGEVRLTRNASRLTVLGLYGLGAFLMATYTANLSSCLILNRPQPFISSIADIKSGRIPFDRIGIVTNSAIWDYYVDNVKQQYYPLSSTDEMYASLLNHTIDAAIWTSPVLEYAVAHEYCGKLVTVPTGFLKSPFAIALPKNWNHRRELDWNILNMRESQTLEKIEDRWFEHQKCSLDRRYSPDNELNGIGKVSFDIMIGIFLFFAMITFVAIGINAWDSWVGFAVAIRRTIRRIII